MTEGGSMITGEEQVRMASVLALRGALGLQAKGFKNRGRSPLTITNELLGTKHRQAKLAYEDLNKYIIGELGIGFDKPLIKREVR